MKLFLLDQYDDAGLLDQYDDAGLDRKKVAAMHALFITTPAPAEPLDVAERDETGEQVMDLEPGQVAILEPGEEEQTPARPMSAMPLDLRQCC